MPRSVRQLLIAEALLGVQFWFPIWLIFLVDRGFPLATIVFADGAFRLTAVLFEVPTGALADRIGRRRSHVLVATSTTVVFLLITAIDATPELLAVWIAWGVLWAMTSGTASAHLYEVLQAEGLHHRRLEVFGSLTAVRTAAALASQLVAGVAYEMHPELPFHATAVLGAAAALVLLTLPRDNGLAPSIAASRMVWRVRDLAPGLRSAIAVAALVLAFGWSVRILVQPLLLDLGIATAAAGLIYTAYAGAGVLAGAVTHRLDASHLPRAVTASWAVLMAGGALTFLAPSAGPWIAVPLLGFGFHLGSTAAEVMVNDHTQDRLRAATLSLAAAAGGIVLVAARPGLGLLADATSVPASFAVWAGAGLLLLPLLRAQLARATDSAPAHGSTAPREGPR